MFAKVTEKQAFQLLQDQRSTVSSKKRQIMLLDEAVYNVKMDFNKRFLALREVKRRVCQQIRDIQAPLRDTLTALGKPTADVVDPRLISEEEPELRDQVGSTHNLVCFSNSKCLSSPCSWCFITRLG